jgi:phosphoglucomutase
MNGSARCLSIDRDWFTALGYDFTAINNEAGRIVHGILPEGENLSALAAEVERIAKKSGSAALVLGYMPDCDGDRGNIVFWDEKAKKARVLEAQEVFALAVMGVLQEQAANGGEGQKRAVVVNGPTSMRIDRIAERFGAAVFRAEVGEANVVNLARETRSEGWGVAILGDGSTGGTILHPQAVRDPLATVTVLLKLLAGDSSAIAALPPFSTTPVDEARAKLHICETDHAALKHRYQKLFETRWPTLRERYGFTAYKAVTYNGTNSQDCTADFSQSGRGGLKVLFYGSGDPEREVAFIWGRGSGTEPLFRVMADVAGGNSRMEHELLEVQRELLEMSDKMSDRV